MIQNIAKGVMIVVFLTFLAVPIGFVGGISAHLVIDVTQAGWELVGDVIN